MIVIALIVVQAKQTRFDSSLFALFPAKQHQSELQQAIDTYSDNASKQVMVLIGHHSLEQAKHHAKTFTDNINRSELIQFNVNTGDDVGIDSLVGIYQKHSGYLLSDERKQQLKNEDYIGFQQALISQLIQTGNPFVSETIEQDPSLILGDFLQQLSAKAGNLSWSDGYLYQHFEDKYFIVLTGTLIEHDGLAIADSERAATLINDQIDSITAMPDTVAHVSGVVFHTSASAQQAKAEINLFGSVSAVFIILLVLIAFASLKPLFMVLLTLATAIAFGVAGVFTVFSSVHLITFVLAISLIGICVDYSFHALCESEDNNQPVNSVARSLFIGFLTTAIGYAAILVSPLTQFKALSVFIVCGLLGALITVYMIFPWFLKKRSCQQSAIAKLSATKLTKLIGLPHYQTMLKVLIAASVVVVVSVPLSTQNIEHSVFNDDVRLLNSSPQSIINDEQRSREILAPSWSSQAIFVQADNAQQVLEREERLIAIIEQAINKDMLVDYLAISSWIPSIDQQDKNYQLLEQATANQGFSQLNQLTGQTTVLAPQDENDHLTVEKVLSSPLGEQFKSQFIEVESADSTKSYFTVIRLKGIKDAAGLTQLLAAESHVHLFDKVEEITSILEYLRTQFSVVLLIAFIATAVLFSLIYGVKSGVKASSLPALASILSLSLSFYWQGYLSLFNLIAALLVMALAIDYTVFYMEKGRSDKVVLAITLSMLSSCAAFGMLAFSTTPAVFSLGLTVLFGVICAYLISPLAISIDFKKASKNNIKKHNEK